MKNYRDKNITIKKVILNSIMVIFLSLLSTNIYSQSNSTYIRIEGSSNVNSFYFEQNINNHYSLYNHLSPSDELIQIEIPVSDFKPSNPMMSKDFFDLIKANEFPNIFIQLSLPALSPLDNEVSDFTSTAKIVFVGKEKEYKINSSITQESNNSIFMEGMLKINIFDFNLTPPTKFMGMVKVDNEVFIKFALNIENNLLTKK